MILKQKLINIELQAVAFHMKILPVNLVKTDIIGHSTFSKSPIKPKKKLIIAVAFVTGLILSVFLVFFLEFLKSFKEET